MICGVTEELNSQSVVISDIFIITHAVFAKLQKAGDLTNPRNQPNQQHPGHRA